MIAQRTEQHLAKAAEKRVERWRKIAREASQQARRIAPPEIADPVALKKAVAEEQGSRIVLSEAEEQLLLKAALADCKPPLALAFGPEGGWSEAERSFSRPRMEIGFTGHTILRAETAAIAAMAVAMAEIGESPQPGTRQATSRTMRAISKIKNPRFPQLNSI